MPRDFVLSTKTFIISHAVILSLGLLFFGGLYYILYEDQFRKPDQNYNPVTKEPQSFILEVKSPEDDTLTYDPTLIVSGKTGPDAAVIVTSGENDLGFQSGPDGQFSKVFNLSGGANIVEITAFDPQGNSKTITKSIYYEQEKI